jgi:hypothetical protein
MKIGAADSRSHQAHEGFTRARFIDLDLFDGERLVELPQDGGSHGFIPLLPHRVESEGGVDRPRRV